MDQIQLARDESSVVGVPIEESVKELRINGVRQLVQGIHEDQKPTLADEEAQIWIGQLDTATAQCIEEKILHRAAGEHMGAQIDQHRQRRALAVQEPSSHFSHQM